MTGFYKGGVFQILLQTRIPLTSKEVWTIFQREYRNELRQYPGKTKHASVESALCQLAVKDHMIKRYMDNDESKCLYRYYIDDDETLSISTQRMEDAAHILTALSSGR